MLRTIEELRALLAAPDTQDRTGVLSELEQLLSAGSTETSPREQLDTLREERTGLVGQIDQIVETAATESRDFTGDEREQRGSLTARIDQLDAQITEREDQVRQDEAEQRKKETGDALAQMRRELGLGDVGSDQTAWATPKLRSGEGRTYERGNGASYLMDLTFRTLGPGFGSAWSRACERLSRHALENHHECLEVEGKATRSAAEEYFRGQMIEQFADREHQSRGSAGFGVAPGSLSYRALSTSLTAGGEFVPPMYLTEQWIEFLRAGRVVANNMHHEDLPDGTMSLNIPKVVTGTSVNVQGTQNTNISDTDITTEWITFPVVTIAGQQIVSLQLLERSPIQFDQVIMADLAKAHGQRIDIQVLNGLGGAGEMTGILNTAGINTITWTQASPTVKGYYGRVGVAKREIAEKIFLPASHQFMTPNCWEWIGQSFDANERPLVVPEYGGPFNVVQVAPDSAQAEGAIGRNLSGLSTFEDANIPQTLGTETNQDVAVISRAPENYLYESPVVTRALPQTYGAQLSVLLQLYNYAAFTAARYPTANSVITGTGMKTTRAYNS